MSKLIKMTLSSCRGNGYLMIGVCLGLSLSLFIYPVEIYDGIDTNSPTDESSWPIIASQESIDEYLPKINLDQKPKIPKKIPKSLIRPRYYSTELGIREKVLIAVSTSREHLHTRGIALNKTIAHLVDRIRYFITIPEGSKPNVSLPGIVGFTDTRDILKPFHIIKYITDNYLEEYDYYLIIKDTSYINGRELIRIVDKLSVSKEIYLGTLFDDESNYCSLDSGILLSNSIIKKLKNNLDWCVKNTFSNLDDINFGRCLQHSTKLDCVNSVDNVKFISTDFRKEISNNSSIYYHINHDSLTVSSIFNHTDVYKVHVYFSIDKIENIERIIENIEMSYDEIIVNNSSTITSSKSWPIGSGESQLAKPSGRFDITRWNYFNESHIFMETDYENSRQLISSYKKEIVDIINFLSEKIFKKYKKELKYRRLINGWRRFDAARGIDYILDIDMINLEGKIISKRYQVAKSLGKAEILSVPYVTENSRINLVVVVENWRIDEAVQFIDDYSRICMEKKDKTSLMLVLLYDPENPSKGSEDVYFELKRRAMELTERFKKEAMKITWLSVRVLLKTEDVGMNPLVKIGIADLVSKKFSPESLIMFVQVGMGLKPEFLNRVRMNTIMQTQIFSPIPFVEYHPDIAYSDAIKPPPEIDINRNNGAYDVYNFESISFYIKDYQNVRKNSERDIPMVRNDKDILSILKLSKDNIIDSIFELFVIYSDLHTLRAVEPALKIRYSDIDCRGVKILNEASKINCQIRRYSRLGHRGQLAKLILDYQNI